MLRANMAGIASPETALAMEARITVLLKTMVDRERQVAMVKGFRRKAAAAAQGGQRAAARLEVWRGVIAGTLEEAMVIRDRAERTSQRV